MKIMIAILNMYVNILILLIHVNSDIKLLMSLSNLVI